MGAHSASGNEEGSTPMLVVVFMEAYPFVYTPMLVFVFMEAMISVQGTSGTSGGCKPVRTVETLPPVCCLPSMQEPRKHVWETVITIP